ncbi:unnamed protein product [Lupinus luteus]|uniref:Uncharacterized protein n=1 Tax=Lupinus luteus TaxID=3873 RepID=A0AAV1W861_LUPLU
MIYLRTQFIENKKKTPIKYPAKTKHLNVFAHVWLHGWTETHRGFHSHNAALGHSPCTNSARRHRDGSPWGPTRQKQRGGNIKPSWPNTITSGDNHSRSSHHLAELQPADPIASRRGRMSQPPPRVALPPFTTPIFFIFSRFRNAHFLRP